MSGVHIDLDEQIDNLRRVCALFQHEFRGLSPQYQSSVPIGALAVFRLSAGVTRRHPPRGSPRPPSAGKGTISER
jgi:hypothetical protein